jgi:pyrimidine deaminase RibD-like protein
MPPMEICPLSCVSRTRSDALAASQANALQAETRHPFSVRNVLMAKHQIVRVGVKTAAKQSHISSLF